MEAAFVASEPVRRPRVLIVDDDPAIRLICSVNLALDGYDVIEATNGQEALQLAFSSSPDLLLVDLSMPVLDGFGLAAALRANDRTRHLPLVFLTGEIDGDTEARAYEAGAAGFFAKPFDPSIVGTFVRRLLTELAHGPRPLSPSGGHAF